MAPFDFNYIQDDLLSVAVDHKPAPVRVSFDATDFAGRGPAPVFTPAAAMPAASVAEPAHVALMQKQHASHPIQRDDNMLRAVAAGRAATIRYDTKIVTHSFTEILLEFLDRNATLTSVGFIICYVSVLRSL